MRHFCLDRVAFAGGEKQVGLQAVLTVVKLAISSAQRVKLCVRAPLQDLTALNYEDLVGTPDRREPMRDDERRAALHQEAQALLDHRFGLRIERACRFVENEDTRLGQDGARNGKPLPLTAAQLYAALSDDRLVTFREAECELIDTGNRAGFLELLRRRTGTREHDVLANGAVKEERLLQHHPSC